MNLTQTERSCELQHKLEAFVTERLEPFEREIQRRIDKGADRWQVPDGMAELKQGARDQGRARPGVMEPVPSRRRAGCRPEHA